MIALFARLATPARPRIPVRTRAVEVFADRFVLDGAVVRWDAVTRVRACKLARFAWDEICLDIGADGLAAPLSLREHEKGFDGFVAMADRRLNFPLAWWSGLDRGSALLFERHTAGAG